jgi:hypothetical protein
LPAKPNQTQRISLISSGIYQNPFTMKHTLMLFFSLSFLLSHGQPQFDNLDLDSLNLVLSEAKEDSNKVKTLLLMHDKFRLSDFPKAVDLAGKAYNLSKKIALLVPQMCMEWP